ncbi:hypothetical protein JCM30760_02540 [Thiomicrorhabdus hydrogeniphila]
MTIIKDLLDYEDIFEQRGNSYHQAMTLFPDARKQEFEQLVSRANLTPNCTVADIPSGGGYLKKYLPDSVIYQGHEPCTNFDNHSTACSSLQSLLPLPWKDESVDCTFSLAGVHHLSDKERLFKEVHRITKPGGTFILSDVAEGSKTADFLDNFVGTYNSTGHNGLYLKHITIKELESTGWSIISKENIDFHWEFDNEEQVADFCRLLFDLDNIDNTQIIDAIERTLGLIFSDGRIKMNWSLTTITSIAK